MSDQDKPVIGDYVRSIDGHHGILTAVKDSPWGPMAIFIVADGRYYHCPVAELEEMKSRAPKTGNRRKI